MEPQKSVGVWIRVSTEDQAEGDSAEHHEKRGRLYAEAKGWEVKTVYHLEGVSGKSVIDNPETERMLKDIKEGNITGLIFSKIARLARSTRQLLDFADLFRESNADLISLQESIDTSSPSGRLFYTMIAAMAQWEREEIASRVSASIPIRAKLGKRLGGGSPYGYHWHNKQFVINEQEAPVLKLIFELFSKHKRKRTVAEELNRMGYRTRKNTKFSGTSISRIVSDTAAKGMRRANYLTTIGKNKSVLKPPSDWVFLPCPQIVSTELWDTCNSIFEEQSKQNKKPGPKAVHLLSGFVKCTCGKKMYVFHEGNPVYSCKPCNKRIPAEDLHEIYYEQLKTFLMTEIEVTDYLSKTDSVIQEKERLLAVLAAENTALRKRMTELINLRIAHELTQDTFAEQFKPIEERVTQINTQLPTAQAEVDFLKIHRDSSDTVLHEAKDLYSQWPTLSFEEKRGVIEIITDSITVDKEDISIRLSYMPTPPSQNGGKRQQSL